MKGIIIIMSKKTNDRLDQALKWCKKNKIGSGRLNIFDRQYKKILAKSNLDKKKSKK